MSAFAPLIGQSQAVELLTQAIAQNRLAPAYLFVGSSGVGKRLGAECFLELLLGSSLEHVPVCQRHRIRHRNHPDLLWVEPTYWHQGKRLTTAEAEAAGVKRKTPPIVRLEQIREITQFLSRPPLEASRSIVVIEQAETMPEAAANALLKTLEEPGKATIILLAPSVDAILPTLVSRCQRIPFSRLNSESMAAVLRKTGYEQILVNPEILALSQGSPGAAIDHWQKLEAIPPDLLSDLTKATGGNSAIALRQALGLARTIAKTLDGETQLWLVDYLQQVFWTQARGVAALKSLEKAKELLRAYVQSQLAWEVTLTNLL
jgi:DNA polymerase-3 subunit delta'